MLVLHSPTSGFSGEFAWLVLALLHTPSPVVGLKVVDQEGAIFDDVIIVISMHSINQSSPVSVGGAQYSFSSA